MSYEYTPWTSSFDNDYVPYGGYDGNEGETGVTVFEFMGNMVDRYNNRHRSDFSKLSPYALEEIASQCITQMESMGGGYRRWDCHRYIIEEGNAGSDQVDQMIWGWVELTPSELVRRYKKILPNAFNNLSQESPSSKTALAVLRRGGMACCYDEQHSVMCSLHRNLCNPYK